MSAPHGLAWVALMFYSRATAKHMAECLLTGASCEQACARTGNVESEPTGSYLAVVVRLQKTVGGQWFIYVDDTNSTQAIPLVPVTMIVRLWRSSATGPLRGSVRLHGSDHWAPIQSNGQLEELVRAWLLGGESAVGPQ
jgi:hypothetical protein